MVQSGGESTMLGQWRIILRQAEEAARAGRYNDALALANLPDVADHHHAVQLRAKLAHDLVARASRRSEADDLAGAIDDLGLAERLGAAPDTLAAARLKLADGIASEVRADLEAGEPARIVERIDGLARHKVGGPSLRRTREIAEAWQNALDEARRGEFGRAHDQLDRAERLATAPGGAPPAALSSARHDVEVRQKAAAPRVEALYEALSEGLWPKILNASESVLETVPEHPAARQARSRAWQQIAAINPSAATFPPLGARVPQSSPASEPEASEAGSNEAANGNGGAAFPNEVAPIVWLSPGPKLPVAPIVRPVARAHEPGPRGRFLLWLDAVGGYLVCLDDQVLLGRAGHDSSADVPLMGDLSRNHAILARNGDGYVLRAHQPTFVNNRAIETAPLKDGDVIRLGASVELEFRQPSPVSTTARLAVVSRHRLPLAVDGILLMADTCIIGDAPQAHISAPGLAAPVLLYRQGNAVWCKASGGFEVDGRACAGRAPLTLQSSVLGNGFSFSLEALGAKNV
jgi:FHA domain